MKHCRPYIARLPWAALGLSIGGLPLGAIAAPVPMIAGGALVGIAGLGDGGCSDETCSPYLMTGLIVSVDRQPKTELPTGFVLRNARGDSYHTIRVDWEGASMLDVRRIRKYLAPGRMVMVLGKRSGDPPQMLPAELLSLSFAQQVVDQAAKDRGTATIGNGRR